MKPILAGLLFVAVAQGAFAGEKERQMQAELATRCMGVPNIAMMSKVADAMKLRPVQEEGAPKDEGYYAHMRSWLLEGDSEGPFMWMVTEANGPKGFMAECSISGFGTSADALSAELKLGKPTSTETMGPMAVQSWVITESPMHTMRIMHGQAPGQPAPMTMLSTNYMFKEKPQFRQPK